MVIFDMCFPYVDARFSKTKLFTKDEGNWAVLNVTDCRQRIGSAEFNGVMPCVRLSCYKWHASMYDGILLMGTPDMCLKTRLSNHSSIPSCFIH